MAANTNKPQIFVVDASFVLAFLLPDENSSEVDGKFESFGKGEVRFTSGSLLPFEVLNALAVSVARKRLEQSKALVLAGDFLELDIEYKECNYPEIFRLALARKVSVYDAAYLWLAKSQSRPLLTLDKKLQTIDL